MSPADAPWPGEVRARILEDHGRLRDALDALDALAAAERPDRGRLRSEFGALLPHLDAHRALEDGVLAPALLEADAWGDVRTASLHDHHDVQAGRVAAAWQVVQDPAASLGAVVGAVTGISVMLRAEMAQEERELLTAELLRDDLVSTGFGG